MRDTPETPSPFFHGGDGVAAAEFIAQHPVPMIVYDSDTLRVLDVNEAASKAYRYPREEFIGLSMIELRPREERERFLKYLAQREDGTLPVRTGIWRHRRKDGGAFDVEVLAHDLDIAGRKMRFMLVLDDSERLRTEAKLRETTERFRAMARATNDALWDWEPKSNALWWGDGFLATFGFDRAEVDPNINFWSERVHPEDRERVLRSLHGAFAGGATSWQEEYRFRRKDGTYAFVIDRGFVLRDEHGRPQRMVGGLADISERVQTEAALRSSEERLKLVVQATTDVIWDWDLAANTIWWGENMSKLFGYRPAELEAGPESWFKRIHPEESQRIIGGVRRCLDEGGTLWQDEYKFRRADGTYADVHDRAFVVRDREGRAQRMVGGLADITERKRLQTQFLRMQRLESIGALAGGIAHDLNNMLAPIITSIEMLRLRTSDEWSRQILSVIERSARHGAGLVQQVLSFARGIESRRARVQMQNLMMELHKLIADTFPKAIQAEASSPPDLWPVFGSLTQVHQVLLNLCVNARDAMPAGGRLTLTAENIVLDDQYASMHSGTLPGRYVLITVTDTGCGIPDALRERIFEPFFTTKPEGQGTGLGLSTAQAIVKDHGGHIHLYSELNKGTTFKIYLPAAPGVETEVPVEHVPFPRGQGECVLVVDDEASILSITQQTLETFGYRVFTAANGADAIALYAQHRRDIALVLTDMLMPIMDGPATIHALLQINPRVKIIGASGLHANGHAAKAAGAGVQHFLPKPYTAATMLNLIHKVLREDGERK